MIQRYVLPLYLPKKVLSDGSFTTTDILNEVQGSKDGYIIKEINTLSPIDVASVIGTKPNISLTMTKKGTFTVTIVLESDTKQDVSIVGATFTIN